MLSTKLFILSLAACISAIPVPNAQTPEFSTLDSCPTNGAIVCSPDGSSFYLCNFGRAVPMGAVAAGTTCKNGEIVTIGASAAPTPKPVPTSRPSSIVEPTSVELVSSTKAAEPTPTPEPPKEDITTTITTTSELKVVSTSTVLVTVTGQSPVESALPSETSVSEPAPTPGKLSITEDVILKIAPSSNTCVGAEFPEECGTVKEATPPLAQAVKQYNIETIGEAAAILSLIAFESGDFKYNKNHNPKPGRPGQGTKSMMMVNFVLPYAQTFGSTDDIAPGLTPENINSQSDEIKNKVLDLVLGDDKTYASAFWFYSRPECDPVKANLQKTPVSIEAWTSYIENCIGTGVTPDRQQGFVNAVEALGGTIA